MDKLTLSLTTPGMTQLHRAGLGGLACTLAVMEWQHKHGLIPPEQLPPWDEIPWRIDERTVTLYPAESAATFLERLFKFAFQLTDGLILMPGQHHRGLTSIPTLAMTNISLRGTFIYHQTWVKWSPPTTIAVDAGDDRTIAVLYSPCLSWVRSNSWRDFIDEHGDFSRLPLPLNSQFNPFITERHKLYLRQTTLTERPELALPLYFAPVGCVTVNCRRDNYAIIVPDVNNLVEFIHNRPAMTPAEVSQFFPSNANDAALQMQVRLRVAGHTVGCRVISIASVPWCNPNQKMPYAVANVNVNDRESLECFKLAMQHLQSHITPKVPGKFKARGEVEEKCDHYISRNLVRALVADNIVAGRRWYCNFCNLIKRKVKLFSEKEGLRQMIAGTLNQNEKMVVDAIHIMMRHRYGHIAATSAVAAMPKRFTNAYQRMQRDFVGAKTCNQFRHALYAHLSSIGTNEVLQRAWADLVPMLRPATWKLTRDLVLLAMCSYRSQTDDLLSGVD